MQLNFFNLQLARCILFRYLHQELENRLITLNKNYTAVNNRYERLKFSEKI